MRAWAEFGDFRFRYNENEMKFFHECRVLCSDYVFLLFACWDKLAYFSMLTESLSFVLCPSSTMWNVVCKYKLNVERVDFSEFSWIPKKKEMKLCDDEFPGISCGLLIFHRNRSIHNIQISSSIMNEIMNKSNENAIYGLKMQKPIK